MNIYVGIFHLVRLRTKSANCSRPSVESPRSRDQDKFTGQPRGFGFVEMSNVSEAQKAIQDLNGKDFMGRSMVVTRHAPARKAAAGVGGGAMVTAAAPRQRYQSDKNKKKAGSLLNVYLRRPAIRQVFWL